MKNIITIACVIIGTVAAEVFAFLKYILLRIVEEIDHRESLIEEMGKKADE